MSDFNTQIHSDEDMMASIETHCHDCGEHYINCECDFIPAALCGHCGTDHSDPDAEKACLDQQEDLYDRVGMPMCDRTWEDDYQYDRLMYEESDLHHEC